MSRSLSKTVCLGLAVTLCATACDDATAPEGDPPELPPQTSFVMDFSDFLSPALAAAPDIQMAPAAGTYWGRSVVIIGIWNAILTGTLAPPTAAFIAAVHHQPEWVDSLDAWTWSYDFNVLNVRHSARLEARFITNGVQWDMYITRDGSFTDFHWYTGVSHASGTNGSWTLNMNHDNPTQYLQIDWERASSGETYELTYTNIVAGNAAYGSYITHGVSGDTPYDAYYDLYGAEGGNLTQIEWNRTTKEGRVTDPAYFGDSDWRCWDSNLDNTTCN